MAINPTSIYTIQSLSNTISNTNYGQDINVTSDLLPIFTLVTGTTLLGNAAYRRIITPYGALGLIGGNPNYGIGAYSWLASEATSANIANWQLQTTKQLNQDERIRTSTCQINFNNSILTMNIVLSPFVGQSFSMVVQIGNITGQELIGT
jgi:hypothetical protein